MWFVHSHLTLSVSWSRQCRPYTQVTECRKLRLSDIRHRISDHGVLDRNHTCVFPPPHSCKAWSSVSTSKPDVYHAPWGRSYWAAPANILGQVSVTRMPTPRKFTNIRDGFTTSGETYWQVSAWALARRPLLSIWLNIVTELFTPHLSRKSSVQEPEDYSTFLGQRSFSNISGRVWVFFETLMVL